MHFRQAAESGNPRAMADLARQYLSSDRQTASLADIWIEKSAVDGCSYALFWKAARLDNYYNNLDKPKWSSESQDILFENSIKLGNGNASCILDFRINPNEYSKRENLYKKWNAVGRACAVVDSYSSALLGQGPYAQNKAEALKKLQALANDGDNYTAAAFDAMINPAKGGVENNPQALPYLIKSAENGKRHSIYTLGLSYALGRYSASIDRDLAY
jgi:TPR repeat protein